MEHQRTCPWTTLQATCQHERAGAYNSSNDVDLLQQVAQHKNVWHCKKVKRI